MDKVEKHEKAVASSAGSRINVPLNLNNWKNYDEDSRSLLLWFHQHCLDERLTLDEAGKAIQYDKSTIYRVLMGTYEGSMENVCSAMAISSSHGRPEPPGVTD